MHTGPASTASMPRGSSGPEPPGRGPAQNADLDSVDHVFGLKGWSGSLRAAVDGLWRRPDIGFAYRCRGFKDSVGTAGVSGRYARGELGHFPGVDRRAYAALVVRGEPGAPHLPGPAQRPPAGSLAF